ncbi:MAG TPA: hypothetical protein DCY12_01940 [Candidatus Atribacteria bacterium]|nr:hypothetical protein [Candidatus Atribacteria bacterium]
MNIVLIADVDFPEGMAATTHVVLMAKGIIKNGTPAIVVIPSKSFNGKFKTENFLNEGTYDSINYKFFNEYPTIKNKFTFNNLKNVLDIAKFLKDRKQNRVEDVVVTYSNDFLKYFPFFLCCYFYRIPLFAWEVEKRVSNKEIGSYRTVLQQLGYRLSDIILPKISDGMILISSFLQSYYGRKIGISKTHISPILVDPEASEKRSELPSSNEIFKYISSVKDKNNIIVYSGSFGEKDGFPYILKAFKLLLKDHPDSILITTGKPGKYNPIEKILEKTKKLGVEQKFKYLGLVTRDELKFINENANLLLVCRSKSEFATHGFPWKLGEYLMTKNPIVATKVGDIENYLKDKQEIYLAQPENVKSIYFKMKEVFDNYALAKEVGIKGCRKAISVFNYIDRAKDDLEFINNSLKGKLP